MEQSISATEARVHLGQWLQRVKQQGMTVIVEKGGRPEAVLLSFEEYGRLQSARRAEEEAHALTRARELREEIRVRRGDVPLPAPEDVIAQARGERDGELVPLR